MSFSKRRFGRGLVFALRWIAVLPVFLVAGGVVCWLTDFTSDRVLDALSHDLNRSGDFAGHYIYGPPYVFMRSLTSTGCSVVACMYTAPALRRQVGLTLAIVMALVSVATIGLFVFILFVPPEDPWPTENLIRSALECVGVLIGGIVGYSLGVETLPPGKPKKGLIAASAPRTTAPRTSP